MEILDTMISMNEDFGMIIVTYTVRHPGMEPKRIPIVHTYPNGMSAFGVGENERELIDRSTAIASKYFERFKDNPPKLDLFDGVPFKKKKKDPNRRRIIRPLQKRRRKGEEEKP
jgi:hypothetical protein